MGRMLLVGRLAARNLRRRPGESALLLLAMMAATTTLTLALALRGVTDDPYERTREATAGADVIASAGAPISQASRRSPMRPASPTTAGRTRWSELNSTLTASPVRGVHPAERR